VNPVRSFGLTASLLLLLNSSFTQASYLQKFVTKYSLEASEVPAQVREPAKPLTVDAPSFAPLAEMIPLAQEKDGALWLGSKQGAARLDPSARDDWERCHYFSGERWLPSDNVQNIFVEEGSPGRKVWVRTDKGVSCLEWRSFTLEEKAKAFEERIARRHNRFGMVATSHLTRPGDTSSNHLISNDNDGLWTAMYLAAQCYRYATTHEPEARAKALRSIELLMRLLEITEIPGLVARSFIPADEAPPGGEWHLTSDKKWLWKGDTSSDEIVGHYYGYSLFYDLLATPEEKRKISHAVARITSYIVDHNFQLLDVDGKPTRWGRWNIEFHTSAGEGEYESALGSVEILSFLQSAMHMADRPAFKDANRKLIDLGYPQRMRDYRRWPKGGEINFSDDELAFLSYFPLLKYETDPGRKSIYLEAVNFAWKQIRTDKNPLWNFMAAAMGAIEASSDVLKDSVATLERIPMETIEWPVHNSHRKDLRFRPGADRFGRRELVEVLPPDERPMSKWNGNPYRPDGGDGANSEDEGVFFLLPYWMGRYHGWLKD
jgi:hypothetical protein